MTLGPVRAMEAGVAVILCVDKVSNCLCTVMVQQLTGLICSNNIVRHSYANVSVHTYLIN